MRDLPPTGELLELARRMPLEGLPPAERERHAHLVETARAIAAREARAGEGWQREIRAGLIRFYEEVWRRGEGRNDNLGGEDGDTGLELLARLAADLRKGAFETTRSRELAARAILWRLVLAKLREGNPQFLAANGFE